MADKNISIILTADNKTKAGFSAVVKNIKDLESATNETAKSTKGLSSGIGNLVKGFTIASLATKAITVAVSALKNEFNATIKTASEYSLALAGLASTAEAFGESQDEARQSALDLANDGLTTVMTTAQGLRALMAGGLSLDKAVELMKAYKDEASFGRSSTLDFDTAVRNLAESFMTESSMIGNLSGQAENYNIILKAGASQMGKSVSQLTQAERVQAKYLGTLTVASKAEGDANRMADTYLGTTTALTNAKKNLRNEIGTALLPAMGYLNQSFTDLLNSMRPTPATMVAIGQTALRITGAIMNFAVAVRTLTEAWWKFNTFRFGQSFDAIKKGVSDIKSNLVETGERMQAVTVDSMQNIFNFSKGMASRLGDFADSTASKTADLAKKVANEIKDYGRDMAKMIDSFNQSLNDLIFSHRDKRNALEKDIASENKTFKKSTDEKKKDFDENMEDLEDRHAEKVSSLESDIADELEAVKLAENQREAFQDDKYLVDINRHKKRVAELKASLEKENSEYFKQTNKLRIELDEQLKDITDQHKDKLTLLQAELAIEMEIEKKHFDDFAKLKDQVKEDDITRLKNQHAEEKAERERDHNEKLAELYSQGASEKASYDSGKQGESQQQAQQAIQQASDQTISVPTVTTPPLFPLETIGVGTVTPPSSSGGNIFSGISSAISDVWSGVTSFFSNLPFFAEGGVVSGSPNEAQLAVVHGQETIIPAGQTGGSVVLNVNIGTLVNSSVERRNFAQQIWLEIGEIAHAQNKTPQELLSI